MGSESRMVHVNLLVALFYGRSLRMAGVISVLITCPSDLWGIAHHT